MPEVSFLCASADKTDDKPVIIIIIIVHKNDRSTSFRSTFHFRLLLSFVTDWVKIELRRLGMFDKWYGR